MNTRENIIAAAAALFERKGFAGTKTAEIAREAGVAEVTLFRHFGGKEQLFSAALEQIQSRADFDEISGSLNGKPDLDLPRIADTLGKYFLEEQATIRMMLFEAGSNPMIRRHIAQGPMKSIAYLQSYFARYTRSEDLDPRELAETFVGGLFGMVIIQFSGNEDAAWRRVKAFTRQFLAGLEFTSP
jgi:AcrR family transcriptional regulator